MTEQPPPSGGYSPPLPAGAGPRSPHRVTASALPRETYTAWFKRVQALLVDYVPLGVILGIGMALLLGTEETDCLVEVTPYDLGELCSTGASTLGQSAIAISFLLAAACVVWNFGYRQGTTGSSIGKSVLKFQVVSEKTGQPIGFGNSILRQVAHVVDMAICYIGYLFPLWDNKRQTIADKLMHTVCMPL